MAILPPMAISAAYQLGFRRTQSLSAEQHLAVLGYLCDELLDTHAVRDTLQSAPQAPQDHCSDASLRGRAACSTLHGLMLGALPAACMAAFMRCLKMRMYNMMLSDKHPET